MNNIIRLWNKNRTQIIIIGLAVVFFIILIQVLNTMVKTKKEETDIIDINNIEIKEELPTKSIISGTNTTEKIAQDNTQIIDRFIENCNNGNIEKAYEVLTDKCKEVLFPTKEIFKSNYVDIIFGEKRVYNIKNWISTSKANTYLVEYFSDVMSTGKVQEGIDFQDYITVNYNDDGKININSFISYEKINKSNENDKIKINVIGKEIYKGYEQYEIEIQNKTEKEMLLDTKSTSTSTYIKGKNGTMYGAILSDLSDIQLILDEDSIINHKIKFNKTYNLSTTIESMNFTDIIEDYETYMQDENNYDDRINIQVEL